MDKVTKEFNNLWENKKISKPIVVVYGGYAGTGKSTNCSMLMSIIKHSTSLSTGIIRSTISNYLTKETLELLSSHTYDLHNVSPKIDPQNSKNTNEIINRFITQIRPISNAINSVIKFAASEKQHILIDGNHVFPGLIKPNLDVHLIEFYNKVTDKNQHYKMLCSPTHNRTLDKDQFTTARILHDYTVDQCHEQNKKIFEYNKADKMITIEIKKFLQEIIEQI